MFFKFLSDYDDMSGVKGNLAKAVANYDVNSLSLYQFPQFSSSGLSRERPEPTENNICATRSVGFCRLMGGGG